MVKVLHLSHTDIRYDARILKEMTALAKSSEAYQIYGIGISMDEGSTMSSQASALEILSIDLFLRKLIYFPKILRHSLTLFELIVKTFFKAIKLKPEIIHCHDTLVLPLGVLLKSWTKSKLIYDAHELESDRNGLSQVLSKLTLYAEKFAWPFVDLLITVSTSINQWYKDNIGPKVSELILNSPDLYVQDLERLVADKNYLRRKYNIPENAKIFIYVGIFGRGRGLEKILEVFSVDCKSHVVFMGYGELSHKILEKTYGNSNLHFHEAVPHEKVVQVIQSADVGLCLVENVSLSDYFCLPNKIFEYAFAGVPVLASDFPDMSEMVRKYSLGVCCGFDTVSIRNGIQKFECCSINYKIDLSKLQELSWEAQKMKLLKAYKELISS